jgi:hypothetical protein
VKRIVLELPYSKVCTADTAGEDTAGEDTAEEDTGDTAAVTEAIMVGDTDMDGLITATEDGTVVLKLLCLRRLLQPLKVDSKVYGGFLWELR